MNGYFLWSAQNSFEWIWGTATDSESSMSTLTLGRTPEVSAEWFRETEKQNAVA